MLTPKKWKSNFFRAKNLSVNTWRSDQTSVLLSVFQAHLFGSFLIWHTMSWNHFRSRILIFFSIFIVRIFFLSVLCRFELCWRWIYCSSDPTTNSEITNLEFSCINIFGENNNCIQTDNLLQIKLILVGQKIRKNWNS